MKISKNRIPLITILSAMISFSASACCCSCSATTQSKTKCCCCLQKPTSAGQSIDKEPGRTSAVSTGSFDKSECDCVNNLPPAEKKNPPEAVQSTLPALKNNCGPVTGTFYGNDMRSCMISRASTTRPPIILSLSAFSIPLRI